LSSLIIWLILPELISNSNEASLSLGLVIFATIISSGILVVIEANQLNFGQNHENTDKLRESNPLSYFVGMIFLWFLFYPLYLFKRSKKGKKNLVGYGVIITFCLILSIAWFSMKYDSNSLSYQAVKNGHLKYLGDSNNLGKVLKTIADGEVTWSASEIVQPQELKKSHYLVEARFSILNKIIKESGLTQFVGNDVIFNVQFLVAKNAGDIRVYAGTLNGISCSSDETLKFIRDIYNIIKLEAEQEANNVNEKAIETEQKTDEKPIDTKEAIITRYGKLTIGNSSELLFNDQIIEPKIEGSLSFVEKFEINSIDIVLVKDTGGILNPAEYYFVRVSESGIEHTPSFGTLSSEITITREGDSIIVSMPGFRGPSEPEDEQIKAAKETHIYTYINNEITERIERAE